MNTALIIGIIYIVGFFVSLIFLSKFGEQIGWGGYDEPQDYSNYDDYSSNASAFLAFSMVWPLFYFMGIIIGVYTIMVKFTEFLIETTKK